MMYVFLGAMFGLVMSSSLTWMYFFWEITSVVSFLLIGYTRTDEAVNNSFKALWMNLLGGCGFCAGIIILGFNNQIFDLQDLIQKNSFGEDKRIYLTNWYMEDWFGEKKLYIPSAAIATAIVVICLAYSLGGTL